MPLKTPDFWQRKGIVPTLLSPLSWVYGCGHKIKTAVTKSYKASIPVICVGGVVAGGSGKTPVVHAIIDLIHAHGLYSNPVILTRGYGGTLKGPTLVDVNHHLSEDVGDEALLHALRAPTIVSKDRADGARLAQAMEADVIILDDGLQNNSLVKDISFLVIDAKQGIGNGQLIPAGPLREPLDDALEKVRAVIYTGGHGGSFSKPVFTTTINIVSEHDKSQKYFGFAGLGRPEKFKETLVQNGFELSGFQNFADHHAYSVTDMDDLIDKAGTHILMTTEKDFVRIPDAYRGKVQALIISLSFDAADAFLPMLKTA